MNRTFNSGIIEVIFIGFLLGALTIVVMHWVMG